MKPSEITAVRDDSFPAQVRRFALWTVLLGGTWLVPATALAIGGLLEGRAPVMLSPGALVRGTLDALRGALATEPRPWWVAFPQPDRLPHGIAAPAIALFVVLTAYTAGVSMLWSVALRRSGLREADRRRRRDQKVRVAHINPA